MYAQPPKALELSARIDLAGVEGRIDHLSVDLKDERIFLAALGNQTLEVLDVKNGNPSHHPESARAARCLLRSIEQPPVCGVRKDGTTRLLDAASFRILETVNYSGNVDNVRYDGRDRRLSSVEEWCAWLARSDGEEVG